MTMAQLDAWVQSWAFWLPYMLGFSSGGMIGVIFVQKIAALAEHM